ncbi:hypothetical protein MCEMIE22_02485 [Mycobacteriaceae bacterium]
MDRRQRSLRWRRAALAAGLVAGAAAIAAAAPAGADPAAADPAPPFPTPPPAVDVPPVPPVPYSPYVAAEETRNNPAGVFTDLIAGANQNPLLAQSATPALPGAAPFQAPSADMLESVSLLMPQNFGMPSDELANPYALAQGVAPGPFARVDAFQGVRALLHGALGRMPREELGLPLAGTAPPPDAVIPPGLVQFLPPPEEIPPPPTQLPSSPPN